MPVLERHHTLIVGGTGMLRSVSHYLVSQGHTVSVIGRDRGKLLSLRAASEGAVGTMNTIRVDYTEDASLRTRLEMAIEKYGKFDLAITWIHSYAPRALEVVADVLNKTTAPCRLFQICSSEYLSPQKQQYTLSATGKIRLDAISDEARLVRFDMVQHRRIILGFHLEQNGSRWLTHEEICGGVLEAVAINKPQFVVGTVTPWEARPVS